MRGVYTCRIIAGVAYNHTNRYRSIKLLEHEPIYAGSLAFNTNLTVSIPIPAAGPYETIAVYIELALAGVTHPVVGD
jgi:hypothetical protein